MPEANAWTAAILRDELYAGMFERCADRVDRTLTWCRAAIFEADKGALGYTACRYQLIAVPAE
ncbi:hypothetical protein [Tanticharoenia sakaeratensis]|uniref:Uncharacterized protein n=1 Tax=Tanticharoenia sakaeratensis NBRC 103193 TaxID=1231623 RepID=A0A0D6MHN8_9PROT|nr:hypothetical protein [Tanticharoenia sakaeratensis]GAN53164.1 hypothetical protein Tasa_007_009 [Tanticharoenia sakaeratensis NBRC 103193]GBQ23905.1 hypothetical protein AA103193_2568 [Tanticharoenia sakaeratensis NBRC 103193]